MDDRYDISVDIGKGNDYSVVLYCHDALCELFELRDACIRLLERIEKMAVGKRRKTTYKTIRRDCAKRNRGK